MNSQLAKRMLRDYDDKNPGTAFAEGLRLSIPEAFELQTAVTGLREARGESVAGYKIGCTCEENQLANGIDHPVWGRLWQGEQFASGASLKKSDYVNLGIEGEFAVTLSQDIDPHQVDPDTVLASIESIVTVIELHNMIMRGDAPRGHELIANNCIHSGVVRSVSVPMTTDVIETDLAILFDGDVVDSWDVLRWPDEILQAIPWLTRELASREMTLKAGSTILTGAFGPPIPLGEKRHVEVVSSAFGSVSASFD
ncbi:MAG: hypothetical protein AAF525_01895 [Pseudomonadota bacterium]